MKIKIPRDISIINRFRKVKFTNKSYANIPNRFVPVINKTLNNVMLDILSCTMNQISNIETIISLLEKRYLRMSRKDISNVIFFCFHENLIEFQNSSEQREKQSKQL